MVSMLSLSCKSKDFCKAFEENGFRIDFPFQFIPPKGNQQNNEWLLIIGSNYWTIDESEDQTLHLSSTESKSSDIFKNDYQLGFSVWNAYRRDFETSFLRVMVHKFKLKTGLNFNDYRKTSKRLI